MGLALTSRAVLTAALMARVFVEQSAEISISNSTISSTIIKGLISTRVNENLKEKREFSARKQVT